MVIAQKERLIETPQEMFLKGGSDCATIIVHILRISHIEHKLIKGGKFVRDAQAQPEKDRWAARFSEVLGEPVDSFLMPKLIVNLDPEYIIELLACALTDPDIKEYVKSLSIEAPSSYWDED